jgi:microcystin-dependent protein
MSRRPNETDAATPLDAAPPMTRRELLRRMAIGGGAMLLLPGCIDEGPEDPGPAGDVSMASDVEPFIGEIRLMSFNFAPKGWALCNGQSLAISQNQALFALLGTTYGGDGRTTFALPNLRGRVPIHAGSGHTLGEAAGTSSHILSVQQMPQHTHAHRASHSNADTPVPSNALLGGALHLYSPSLGRHFDPADRTQAIPRDAIVVPATVYAPAGALTPLAGSTITSVGGSQPHNNMQPYLTLNFCIALQGIFPSRN